MGCSLAALPPVRTHPQYLRAPYRPVRPYPGPRVTDTVQRLTRPFFRMSDGNNDQTRQPPLDGSFSSQEAEVGATPQAVEQWFDSLPHDEDTPKEVEEQALRDFLTGKTSADVAAKKLTSVVAESEAPEEHLPRVWSFINEAAVDLPGVQEKILDLLEKIQKLPDVGRGRRSIVWKDLPDFANDIRDRWDCE